MIADPERSTKASPTTSTPLLEMKQIGKSYFTDTVETRALRDVTLNIERGEYVSIEGPSGCGKSTLLSIIGLLDVPTAGEYVLNGRPVARLSLNQRAKIRNREIGFIFQSFNLIGDLTVEENVELPLVYRGMTRSERKARVSNVLERVGIMHRRGHYPAQLSGGQQQRVAVARALAGEPSLLLADEPTGNLDTTNGQSVMDLLEELHKDGSTIVMVTHDRRFARCAQRTIGLLDGQLTSALERVEAQL
ncbi:MAG: ABC transporter ATP-binding protein [Candidatus Eremiobacteraeota bacterium]|nr:ABC transporter ATP-binding protein [Candidatus Eremiobacteraeota bacterium]